MEFSHSSNSFDWELEIICIEIISLLCYYALGAYQRSCENVMQMGVE